ncbi:MurR/RpiR family transcriptional regulator [Pseudoflavonifractor sp.]|jgi:DNA-binding MurR/RpiR family transcriptional regulator|uniref:MurR/RpiR family transcriptional regulator n=1 Tax=Pseudoflavonifractor sp. TaxID=1980281 RepID=UPI003D8E4A88
MPRDVLASIQSNMSTFSKGQKLIANFILESYDKAAFMTASKLGKTVNVSESTVVRFAAELGYDGYPAMQKALQEMIRNKLTSIQRIEVSNDRIGDHDILSMVMQADMEKIRLTMEETSREAFTASVDAIVSARRIYIMGIRSASAITSFLGFYFNLIFDNVVVVHTSAASELFEQLLRVGEGDVVIGVSFPRYSRRTVRAMEFAQKQGATVLAITDSEASPLTAIADHSLLAKSDMASFVDSLVAPLSLVNALIVAVGRKKNDDLSETFGKLEKIWDEYEVYEKIEDGTDRSAET